jgi:hypothetical protein
MKRLVVALLLLLAAVPVTACDIENCQVPVSSGLRVHNYTGIQCVYSSLETCARYQGIKELYDLTDLYKDPADFTDTDAILLKRGVHFEQVRAKTNLKTQVLWVKDKVADGYPVCVGIKPFPYCYHMVTVIHFKDGIVKYIDPDDELNIKTLTEDEFLKQWQGWGLILKGK